MLHIITKSATEQKHRKPRNLNYDIITKRTLQLNNTKTISSEQSNTKTKKISSINKQHTLTTNHPLYKMSCRCKPKEAQ